AGISLNSCHPGDVNSTLSHDLGFGGSDTPEQGAATPVWLATTPEGMSATGRYFSQMHEERCRFSDNKHAIEVLFAACLQYD
ncbi:MAG: retinol dehydrogenase, partial [Anaerolineae bacterium]|nr:retinol dehydrogenase [Anaerolineae bacterium]